MILTRNMTFLTLKDTIHIYYVIMFKYCKQYLQMWCWDGCKYSKFSACLAQLGCMLSIGDMMFIYPPHTLIVLLKQINEFEHFTQSFLFFSFSVVI